MAADANEQAGALPSAPPNAHPDAPQGFDLAEAMKEPGVKLWLGVIALLTTAIVALMLAIVVRIATSGAGAPNAVALNEADTVTLTLPAGAELLALEPAGDRVAARVREADGTLAIYLTPAGDPKDAVRVVTATAPPVPEPQP